MLRPLACALCAAALLACSGSGTRPLELQRIAPAADPSCGAAGDGRTILVTALGEFSGEFTDVVSFGEGEVRLDGFPAATLAFELQVLGTGGVVRTIGRTMPFDVQSLDDGDAVPIFMAPRRGFCPTGPPGFARDRPLLVRAGDAVLVAGGVNESGPVREVELYDPRSGEFRTLEGEFFAGDALGLLGARLSVLADNRVLATGRTSFQLFDPESESFSEPFALRQSRAHHVAVPLGDGRVFLAGGCPVVDSQTGACVPSMVALGTSLLDVETGELTEGPVLSLPRVAGQALLEADGRITLLGGVDGEGDPVLRAERVDPQGKVPAEILDDIPGRGAFLASGAALVAFGSAGAPAQGRGVILPPGAAAAADLGAAGEPRAGATVTPLEDGRVLVLGGLESQEAAEALYYVPIEERFEELSAAPASGRRGHGALRLADGTVLVVGGRGPSGEVLSDAWIFRPDLTGPLTGELPVALSQELAEHVVPSDPAQAALVEGRLVLTSSGAAGEPPAVFAVVAGPRPAEPTVRVSAAAAGGGIAVLFGFRGPRDYHFVKLRPGQGVELLRLEGGLPFAVGGCTGTTLEGTLADPVAITVVVEEETVAVELGGEEKLRCEGGELPPGLAGVGVLGPEGTELVVNSIQVSR